MSKEERREGTRSADGRVAGRITEDCTITTYKVRGRCRNINVRSVKLNRPFQETCDFLLHRLHISVKI